MDDQKPTQKLTDVSPERFMKKFLERVGEALDKKLGRASEDEGELSISTLIEKMKKAIDEKVRDKGRKGQFAPHLMQLKIEWVTHSEAPPEVITKIENEILAAAIDHINDNRYRTLDTIRVETSVDVFTKGITVVPSFGEFEEQLNDEEIENQQSREEEYKQPLQEVKIIARILLPNGAKESVLIFQPGGRRLSVGRAKDSNLYIDNPTVSKVHSAMVMNREGNLLVADTGSTNGTYINGVRMKYGEAKQIEDGDVVSFGDVEVRFRKLS
jgi:hypothetical protein